MLLNITTTKNQAHTARGGRARLLFFSFLFFIYFIKFIQFIQFNSIQFNSSSKLAFLQDARELVARQVRQTCAARSGQARSHGLLNKAVTVVVGYYTTR